MTLQDLLDSWPLICAVAVATAWGSKVYFMLLGLQRGQSSLLSMIKSHKHEADGTVTVAVNGGSQSVGTL